MRGELPKGRLTDNVPALQSYVRDLETEIERLRAYEESEAMYQQEKTAHAQTRRDLDAKDHEIAMLKAEMAKLWVPRR